MNIARVASLVVRKITQYGSTVTFPDATTLKAIKEDNIHKVARYAPVDALEIGEKALVLFHFAGSVFASGTGQVMPNKTFTHDGLNYKVDSVHPNHIGDTCVELVVVATRD